MILDVKDLVVRRGGRTIVAGIGLHGDAGEIVGITGKNGCGKSTLLLAIAGVLQPTEGRVTIDGHNVWGTAKQRRDSRRVLGYVPEAADPPGFLLGGELWGMVAGARGVERPSPNLIAALGLEDLRDVALDRMSLGQRRRACLAAALLGPPHLLVLDEPDNGLDGKHATALADLLIAHRVAGQCAVVATHDRELLARIGAREVRL
ncbi:MAG TPA: ABC transporter ATP-binding protein [Kofleriaceae bacterium]